LDASLLNNYFPALDPLQKRRFERLFPLYEDWNSKINVISRKDLDELYTRHILHSLAIARFISFRPDADILDLGTGGGFPGIPLAIFFPETRFTLVDSIGKKIKVVQEIVDTLELQNVTALHGRAEKAPGTFDFVVTRAVARARQLWQWSQQKIKTKSLHDMDNGILALKGGELDEELKELNRPYSVTDLSTYFSEPFFETKKIIYIPK